jgi:competence protein ComGC
VVNKHTIIQSAGVVKKKRKGGLRMNENMIALIYGIAIILAIIIAMFLPSLSWNNEKIRKKMRESHPEVIEFIEAMEESE